MLTDVISRSRRRRDSGAIKDLRDELQYTLDEISVHVDAVLDEWLTAPADGKLFLPRHRNLANEFLV